MNYATGEDLKGKPPSDIDQIFSMLEQTLGSHNAL